MKTLTLLTGILLALLLGFCMGYEYHKNGYTLTKQAKRTLPGYTLIEAGKGINSQGDTITIKTFTR